MVETTLKYSIQNYISGLFQLKVQQKLKIHVVDSRTLACYSVVIERKVYAYGEKNNLLHG